MNSVDSRLRTLNNEQLGCVAAAGCLRARELSNGDYHVEVGGGLKGGGPVAGVVAYWVVKVILWSGLVVVSAPTPVPGLGAALAGATAAGGIEAASAGAGAAFTLIPFLP